MKKSTFLLFLGLFCSGYMIAMEDDNFGFEMVERPASVDIIEELKKLVLTEDDFGIKADVSGLSPQQVAQNEKLKKDRVSFNEKQQELATFVEEGIVQKILSKEKYNELIEQLLSIDTKSAKNNKKFVTDQIAKVISEKADVGKKIDQLKAENLFFTLRSGRKAERLHARMQGGGKDSARAMLYSRVRTVFDVVETEIESKRAVLQERYEFGLKSRSSKKRPDTAFVALGNYRIEKMVEERILKMYEVAAEMLDILKPARVDERAQRQDLKAMIEMRKEKMLKYLASVGFGQNKASHIEKNYIGEINESFEELSERVFEYKKMIPLIKDECNNLEMKVGQQIDQMAQALKIRGFDPKEKEEYRGRYLNIDGSARRWDELQEKEKELME